MHSGDNNCLGVRITFTVFGTINLLSKIQYDSPLFFWSSTVHVREAGTLGAISMVTCHELRVEKKSIHHLLNPLQTSCFYVYCICLGNNVLFHMGTQNFYQMSKVSQRGFSLTNSQPTLLGKLFLLKCTWPLDSFPVSLLIVLTSTICLQQSERLSHKLFDPF